MRRQKIRKALVLISFLLFPITMNYLSPYLIIEGASQKIISGSFLFFGLLFVASFFFGRAFCGWVCPGAGLQETCVMVQDKPVKRGDWVKYVIWALWIGVIIFVAKEAGGFQKINPLFRTENGISVSEPQNYVIFYFVIGLFVLLAFAVGRRSFCHHVCWMAPFMIIGRKIRNAFQWPSLRLKSNKELCTHCKKCVAGCPMSLEVEQMVEKGKLEKSECILCGNCIDVCPKGVIKYSWNERRVKEPANLKSSKHQSQ